MYSIFKKFYKKMVPTFYGLVPTFYGLVPKKYGENFSNLLQCPISNGYKVVNFTIYPLLLFIII